jgi:acetyl esterase/lipase
MRGMNAGAVRWLSAVVVGVGCVVGAGLSAVAQRASVPLWANGAPGSESKTAPEAVTADADGERSVTSVNNPSITPYLVRGPRGAGAGPVAAIIVAPGGGHYKLTVDDEGYDVAKYLSGHGVAAFVLKYRLAREPKSTYTVDGDEMNDMRRAIRMVRARAAEWGIDPARVGVMGFSAGGELAIKASMSYDDGNPNAVDPYDRPGSKPDFEVLMYPGGLTPEIDAKVTKDMPPAFLLCGADDRPDISQGLPALFIAMKKAGVPAELHEYGGVGHGFGLRLTAHGGVSHWPDVLLEWMDGRGLLRGDARPVAAAAAGAGTAKGAAPAK